MILQLSQWIESRWPEWHQRNLQERFGAGVGPVITRIGLRAPRALPALARWYGAVQGQLTPPPYDWEDDRTETEDFELPAFPPRPERGKRSILFLHNSYYHFFHLAAALRRRGWDAVLVSIFPQDYAAQQFFHGEDVNLYSADTAEFSRRLHAVYRMIPERFRMVQFAGMHHMGLFPENFDLTRASIGRVPWDFLELKRRGVKIGYTNSGCHDGIRQSAYRSHTGACSKCVWELHPDVCSDRVNSAWGQKLVQICDLIASEEDYALEWRGGPQVFREPLTICLDPDLWRPNLEVPERLRLPRADGEVIVLHGFGNIESRTRQGRDIKGTGAISAAVERLRSEGVKVRLERVANVPSRDMRFLQAQADIIADQLNVGRYGAQAREGMMLGKPTICYLDPREPNGATPLRSIGECPLVQATEETVYDVLKRLLASPEERARIGRESRTYAMKWHSADACAARFERVYDRLMAGLPIDAPEVLEPETAKAAAA